MEDEQPKNQNLMGNPVLEMVKRAAMVYVFWFVLMVVLGFVYNEVVISNQMKRLTSDAPVDVVDDASEGLPDIAYEKFRLENHQILSFAASFAAVALMGRFLLEWVCYMFGETTCSIISGQRMSVKKELLPATPAVIHRSATPQLAQDCAYNVAPPPAAAAPPQAFEQDASQQLPPLPTGMPRASRY